MYSRVISVLHTWTCGVCGDSHSHRHQSESRACTGSHLCKKAAMCAQCGREIDGGGELCSQCASSLLAPRAQVDLTCAICREPLPGDMTLGELAGEDGGICYPCQAERIANERSTRPLEGWY